MILIKDVPPDLHDIWAAQWEAMGSELREKIATEMYGESEQDDMTPYSAEDRVKFASNRARRIIGRWASTLLLPAKVACVNACIDTENILSPKYHDAFGWFVSTKILLASGGLMKNVLAKMPADGDHKRPDGVNMQHYLVVGGYSIHISLRASIQTKAQDCVSHHTTAYIGTLQGAVLTSLYPLREPKALIDIDTLRATAAAYKEAKAAAEKLKEQLVPFTDEDLRFA